VLNGIGVSVEKGEENAENQAIVFDDPGYNNSPVKGAVLNHKGSNGGAGARKFISPSEVKKKTEAAKPNGSFDIFSLDSQQTSAKTP
jgi:hypothetical protein